jgi:hypothetical protein
MIATRPETLGQALTAKYPSRLASRGRSSSNAEARKWRCRYQSKKRSSALRRCRPVTSLIARNTIGPKVPSAFISWMDSYCRDHPRDVVADAAYRLVAELIAKRTPLP